MRRWTGFEPAAETFDVFDTVLTRAVGEPTSVFLMTGRLQARRQITTLTPEVFARARESAERRAHAHRGAATSLDDIVDEMGFAHGLDGGQLEALRHAELEVERSTARAVPGAGVELERARRRWGRIVFISDTYLPSTFVLELLSAQGLWEVGDRLYVSCEAEEEKRTGRLFATVARAEGTSPWRLVHHGNDLLTDVRRARQRGVRAVPRTDANLNRYERTLEEHREHSGGLTSTFAGASRLARLRDEPADRHVEGIRVVAAGVVGPLLTGFVLWLLQEAQRSALQRLYFVSRDGEILLDIARRLAPTVGYEGELRYLYGSRQAWSLPSTAVFDEFTEGWLMRDTDYLSVRSVFARAESEPSEVGGILTAAGFPGARWDENLTRAQRNDLLGVLRQPDVSGLIERRAAEKRPLLLDYLRQEGLLDGTPSGVVDLGWVGRIGAALVRVAAIDGASPPSCFYYFGLSHAPPPELTTRAAYLFDRGAHRGFAATVPGRAELLEAFCAGSHGVVLGYERDGDRVAPVLKSVENVGALRWGLPELRATVAAFVDVLLIDRSLVDQGADPRPGLVAVLRAFASAPTRAEARSWGSFPFSTDQTDTYERYLAFPYGIVDVLWAVLTGAEHRRRRRYWAGGSVALSTPVIRWLMGRPLGLTSRVRRKAVGALVRRG